MKKIPYEFGLPVLQETLSPVYRLMLVLWPLGQQADVAKFVSTGLHIKIGIFLPFLMRVIPRAAVVRHN